MVAKYPMMSGEGGTRQIIPTPGGFVFVQEAAVTDIIFQPTNRYA